MPTFRVTQTSTASPEAVVAALTDFGPTRATVFPTSEPEHFRLHGQGDGWADVTEGNKAAGGNWERLRYDWSTRGRVVATTVDSNLWGGDSRHTWTVTPATGGGSTVEAVTIRTAKNGRGRLLAVLLGLGVGRSYATKGMKVMLAEVEARQTRSR